MSLEVAFLDPAIQISNSGLSNESRHKNASDRFNCRGNRSKAQTFWGEGRRFVSFHNNHNKQQATRKEGRNSEWTDRRSTEFTLYYYHSVHCTPNVVLAGSIP